MERLNFFCSSSNYSSIEKFLNFVNKKEKSNYNSLYSVEKNNKIKTTLKGYQQNYRTEYNYNNELILNYYYVK